MPCESLDDQDLVSRVVRLRRQLQDLDQRHEEIQQRLRVPMDEARDSQLEQTEEEISLTRRRDELWERQQHFLEEVSQRGLDETLLDKAVQTNDAQSKQERAED